MNPDNQQISLNEVKLFELSQKRTRIAMHEWMRRWRLPIVEPLCCPHCSSEKISKLFHPRNGKIYRCSACQQDFSLEEVPGCRCTFPGGLLKCFDCQHYQAMMAYVEQRAPQLNQLTENQLDAILRTPNFYKRDLNRYPPQVNLKDRDRSEELSYLHRDEGDTKVQLSLFDGDENP